MLHYETIPVTPFEQNCSLIWCDETSACTLVDPGGDLERLLERIKTLDLKLEQICVTHAHIDHAGAVGTLAKAMNVPIIGPHIEDQFWIDLLPQQGARYGFEHATSFQPTRWLHDLDQVNLGAHQWLVRHCPGHTPGHVVFYSKELERAFVGDVLFAGSIGRTDFPKGDHQTLLNSITGRLWPLGDETVFIPGHGPESSFGQERKTNPYVGGT